MGRSLRDAIELPVSQGPDIGNNYTSGIVEPSTLKY
jgi:hypothetical protein